MNKEQLELTFETSPVWPRLVRKSSRKSRAQWWFEQMHQIVDQAFDWSQAPAQQPQQISLELPKRLSRRS